MEEGSLHMPHIARAEGADILKQSEAVHHVLRRARPNSRIHTANNEPGWGPLVLLSFGYGCSTRRWTTLAFKPNLVDIF